MYFTYKGIVGYIDQANFVQYAGAGFHLDAAKFGLRLAIEKARHAEIKLAAALMV